MCVQELCECVSVCIFRAGMVSIQLACVPSAVWGLWLPESPALGLWEPMAVWVRVWAGGRDDNRHY